MTENEWDTARHRQQTHRDATSQRTSSYRLPRTKRPCVTIPVARQTPWRVALHAQDRSTQMYSDGGPARQRAAQWGRRVRPRRWRRSGEMEPRDFIFIFVVFEFLWFRFLFSFFNISQNITAIVSNSIHSPICGADNIPWPRNGRAIRI